MSQGPSRGSRPGSSDGDVRWFRVLMGVVIVGLVLSGVTAFPLLAEMELLGRWLGLPAGPGLGEGLWGLRGWIYTVREGLRTTYAAYPWVAYGTDWLAFGHLVIAGFFVGPLVWPRRDHRSTLLAGIAACVAVLPMALIAGEVRGIPWGWRIIDCGFGVVGLVPAGSGVLVAPAVARSGGGGGGVKRHRAAGPVRLR